MKKKAVSALLCGAMAVSLLAGCGSGDKPAGDVSKSSESSSAAEASEPAGKDAFKGEEISILVSAGWMDNRYDATIERFEETYGVTVDLQTIPADQYSDILQSNLTNGTCPDVFWIQSNPFAIESTIVDPDKYCIDFTGAAWKDLMPETRQASCVYQDKLYGLQIWHNSPEYIMMYNKTLFDELGIKEVPETYADFKKDCEIIAAKGITPWFLPGADGWQHQLAFFQIGGVYTEDNKNLHEELNTNKTTFADNKKMLEVLTQFKELSDAGYLGEDWIGTDSTNLVNEFGDRTCAMAMANSSFIKQVQEETGTKDEFGLFLLPLGDNSWYPTNPAGPTMFGYKGTEHEDLVRAWFDFVAAPESLQEILDNSPAYTNLDVNAEIEQHWLPEEEAFMKTVDPAKMEAPVLQTATKYTNDYWMNFGEDMVAFCQGSIEANDVLKNMDANRAEAAEAAGDPNWK